MITFIAVGFRIFSNSLSNVFQKQLANGGISPYWISFLSYLGLSLICIPFAIFTGLDINIKVLLNATLGGLFGAFGNYYLIKALKFGDLSVLGPINAYKSVVAMLIAIVMLKEIPSLTGVFAVFLIVAGSYFVVDANGENFNFALLKNKGIKYRILALILTAIEAIFIKNVILASDVYSAFYIWCWFAAVFSFFMLITHTKIKSKFSKKIFLKILMIILSVGTMQLSTNIVLDRMNVGYALALFQLSALVSVFLGWKVFQETNIFKKFIGTIIMILGAVILILTK